MKNILFPSENQRFSLEFMGFEGQNFFRGKQNSFEQEDLVVDPF